MTPSNVLVLDFETWDPNLTTYGAGWVFKMHYPEYPFEPICVGLRLHTGEEKCIFFYDKACREELLNIIKQHDTIICHNGAYDIGILYYMFKDELDFEKLLLVDTLILAKLNDQHIEEKARTKSPYSLDTLTNFYHLTETKETSVLTDYVWESGTYKRAIKIATGVNKKTRPSENVLTAFCYKDLRIFPDEILQDYCMQDIRATYELYKYLVVALDLTLSLYRRYSDILWVCIVCKSRGVRIDLKKAKELIKTFSDIRNETKTQIIEIIISKLGLEYSDTSIDSPKQLAKALLALGYDLDLTEKGNPSIKKEWLECQAMNDELLNLLIRYRKTHKNTKDFLKKIIDYQEAIPPQYRNKDYGVLYPSLKPFGATKTGRFSSGGGSGSKELSIQQIPTRDEEFSKPLRELFVPFDGEYVVCGDFNGQESRIQVHYASLLGCTGAQSIVEAWHKDPSMKYHQKVAEFTHLKYDIAKMINLALSYDMHNKKLCLKLGLGFKEGMAIIDQYHRMLPFMSELQTITAQALAKNGYIRTIGSRKLYMDLSYVFNGRVVTKERKALSKLIQGSAADQCIEAMIRAHKAGLKILFSVHDEIVLSSANPNRDLPILKRCMEEAYQLRVPVVADCDYGKSWGEAK